MAAPRSMSGDVAVYTVTGHQARSVEARGPVSVSARPCREQHARQGALCHAAIRSAITMHPTLRAGVIARSCRRHRFANQGGDGGRARSNLGRSVPVPLTIAHRGASGSAPENTLAAVRRAIADGADFIEVDARVTHDGAVVVMHDETLVRTTDAPARYPLRSPWRTQDLRLDELQSLDAGEWFASTYCGEPVPTLEQVIELVESAGVGLLVELKTSVDAAAEARALLDALRSRPAYLDRALYDDRLVVQSFNWDAMRAHRAAAPEIPVGLLGRPHVARLPELSRWVRYVNPHHLKIDRSYVARVRSAGMKCWVWTVDHPVLIGRATRLGVDGIITNHPQHANHIRERGHGNVNPARPPAVTRPTRRAHAKRRPAVPA